MTVRMLALPGGDNDFYYMFSHFDTIPVCYGQTDILWQHRPIIRAMHSTVQ